MCRTRIGLTKVNKYRSKGTSTHSLLLFHKQNINNNDGDLIPCIRCKWPQVVYNGGKIKITSTTKQITH